MTIVHDSDYLSHDKLSILTHKLIQSSYHILLKTLKSFTADLFSILEEGLCLFFVVLLGCITAILF